MRALDLRVENNLDWRKGVMEEPKVLYYGPSGLQPLILTSYFAKLGLSFVETKYANDLLAEARGLSLPIVILSGACPQHELIDLAHRLRPDRTKSFPRVFILDACDEFDTQDDGVTAIPGQSTLHETADRIFLTVLRSLHQ